MCKKLLAFILILHVTCMAVAADCESFFSSKGVRTYPYMSEDRSYSVAQRLSEMYAQRSGEDHIRYDYELTRIHAEREMTFQVKNPRTGFYDKFVDVPANSRAVVLHADQFDELIQSTGPVLRKLRELLQIIYSGQKINAENLGLDHLDKDTQKLVLETIKTSIYLEPELIDPRMIHYPFLAVSGFDGAIGNPDNPDPRFFEMNLGTPSGLSNNLLLLEALLSSDEEFRRLVGPYLPEDNTFKILKETIDSNAKAWTGAEGISVIVSPGVYNGAHADVAAISNLTGMPIVKPENLYMDTDGTVRLKNPSGYDPRVTGFYGRMEESFFVNSETVPMISPMNIETNKQLSKKLGIKLREAASYQYVRDASGEIVDVERDEQGNPIFAQVWTKLGDNPNGTPAPMDMAAAIRSGKIYYSAIGGRVVDDKRLFPIVSEYLVDESDKAKVARPVSTLERSEYQKLYDDPKAYVVKEPNNSGGVGVYFLLDMEDDEIESLIQKVKNNPNEYEVQSVRSPNTLLHYQYDGKSNVLVDEVATDIRIFPMMDSEGNVRAGPNSLLFRTGPTGSFFSNTSKGGGYGVVAVARGGEPGDDYDYKYYGYEVRHPTRSSMAKSQANEFSQFLNDAYGVLKSLDQEPDSEALQHQLKTLSFQFRDLMDLVPEEVRYVAALLRYYAEMPSLNWQHLSELESRLSRYFWELELVQGQLDPRLIPLSKVFYNQNHSALRKYRNFGSTSLHDFWVPDGVELRYLETPERTYYVTHADGSMTEKYDVAEVISVPDPEIQKVIDEVKAGGGQLRISQELNRDKSGREVFGGSLGGFWVNHSIDSISSYMVPVISYNMLKKPGTVEAARAKAVLSHELEHFRFWKETYEEYVSRGMDKTEATKAAYEYIDSEEMLVVNERRAVDEEINVEKRQAQKLGLAKLGRPLYETDFGIVNRMLYPEFEAMRRHLLKAIRVDVSDQQKSQHIAAAKKLLRTQVLLAKEMKAEALYKLSGGNSIFKKIVSKMKPNPEYSKWDNASLVDLIAYPYGNEWLVRQKTLKLFVTIYQQIIKDEKLEQDLKGSRVAKLVSDHELDPILIGLEGEQQQQQ